MLAAVAWGWDTSWYAAARQSHGHAQLLGWGGAMIFGVGLHFLPRLRGTKLAHSQRVPGAFYVFATGLIVRVVAQPWAALAAPAPAQTGQILLLAGSLAETAGILAILTILATTLRQGPDLAKKPAFRQIIPPLAVAGLGLLLALAVWLAGALVPLFSGSLGANLGGSASGASGTGGAFLLAHDWQQLGVTAALFGFIPALSLAMTARIFPLFFRIQAAHTGALNWSAGLLAVGLVSEAAAWVLPQMPAGLPEVLLAAGLLVGVGAVKVFARRLDFHGDEGQYRIYREPGAVGALTAYVWAALGALALGVYGLNKLGLRLATAIPPRDWAIHAVGAGFMTLLIIAVGAVMIPGFGGGRPQDRNWLWVAVIAANLAVLSRTLFIGSSSAAGQQALALSGGLGALATVALAVNLYIGLQPAKRRGTRSDKL